ncbi:MAG TPA: hypothetical protein DD727_09875 [Clostridiales bacterium]|nr:hypothetical protein [Clostridiales bacterium]
MTSRIPGFPDIISIPACAWVPERSSRISGLPDVCTVLEYAWRKARKSSFPANGCIGSVLMAEITFR